MSNRNRLCIISLNIESLRYESKSYRVTVPPARTEVFGVIALLTTRWRQVASRTLSRLTAEEKLDQEENKSNQALGQKVQ